MTEATPHLRKWSTTGLCMTILALGLLVARSDAIVAQDASPVATPAALGAPVERAECEAVQPLTREELDARVAAVGTPIPADPGTPTPGDGQPVDAATRETVTRTVRAYFACAFGGGANAQLAALTGDRVLAEGVAEGGEEVAVAMTDASASPPPAWEAECLRVGVREARVVPDGRVVAIVDVALCSGSRDPDTGTVPGDLTVNLIVLAPYGDRYGIEWWDVIEEGEVDIPVSEEAMGAGTPVAGG